MIINFFRKQIVRFKNFLRGEASRKEDYTIEKCPKCGSLEFSEPVYLFKPHLNKYTCFKCKSSWAIPLQIKGDIDENWGRVVIALGVKSK